MQEILNEFLSKKITRDEALKRLRNDTKLNKEQKKISAKHKLSSGQVGLYTLYTMEPDSWAYNAPGAFRLHQQVDETVLENALQYLVHSHDMLQSYISSEDDFVWRKIQKDTEFKLLRYNLKEGEFISNCLEHACRTPFKLDKAPLFRAILFKEPNGSRILFLNFHHIIFDGFSARNLLQELKKVYCDLKGGRNTELIIADDKYSEFTREESNYLKSKTAQEDKFYFTEQLSGENKALVLNGKKLESGDYENDGTCYSEYVDPLLLDGVRAFSVGKPATLAAKMLAAYMVMLYRLSGQKDLRIGMPVSNRGIKYENAIGYYINMIVIRQIIEESDSYEQLINNVQKLIYEGIEHGKYPYSQLIKDVSLEKREAVLQLFQCAFYFNSWPDNSNVDLIAGELDEIHQMGEYDLTMEIMTKTKEHLQVRLKYNQTIFTDNEIKMMMKNYKEVLSDMVNDSLKQIGIKEKEVTFMSLFYDQVRRTPSAKAVVFESKILSYGELYDRSWALSRQLKQQGVAAGSYVGILLKRSHELLVSLIAVMMSGGVYIPLDPIFPKDRLEYMAEQAKMDFLITDEAIINEYDFKIKHVISWKCDGNIDGGAEAYSKEAVEFTDASELAYILFTSGSTGKPKGIKITHSSLANLLLSMTEKPGCDSSDYLLAVTTISFDIAALEMFMMLIVGGTVEIVTEDMARDGISLLEKLEESGTTIMQATPATWQMLLAAGWEQIKLQKILCGGEALTRELGDKLIERADEVWNMYGPTETTIWSMVCKVEKGLPIHLGEPIRNTTLYIMDEKMRLVEDDEIGELCIGGSGISPGYLNNQEETKKKFVYSDLGGGIIYRTGDLVKRTINNEILYMGRKDFQVKLNGFRIELGEIEEALMKIKGIGQAVVQLMGEDENKYLSAFLIEEIDFKGPERNDIRANLELELPDYMIPAKYYYISSYPLTLNGKVDRKQLGQLKQEETKTVTSLETENPVPYDTIKSFILKEMSNIKKMEPSELEADRNFGEYGFDSISFTKLCVSINNHFHIKIKPTIFYNHQNLHAISNYIGKTYFSKTKLPAFPPKGTLAMDNRVESDNAVAIIGIGGKFPGADNMDEYWQNLLDELDLVMEIPSQRYDWRKYFNKEESDPNRISSKWGGFINDVDKFDAEFFRISPREAELMDPQQRLMLEVVWQTIENAGYDPSIFSGQNVGVYIGATSTDYMEILLRESEVKAHTLTGVVNAVIANRISYLYNFKGPSETIDTACSSSLVSISRAVESIRSKSCDLAIAGGVNLLLSPFPQIALSKSNMLSTDGKCKAFDERANGYVRGEGGATLFLKPLKKALADRDHIYATIKGVALNHSGKTNSLTAPNPQAQSQLIQKAFSDANFAPDEVSYIETHGTGTALGDPIEIEGIKDAFENLCQSRGSDFNCISCGLGSVKTNIGHLEAASGAASIIKLIMALEHKRLPATIHQQKANPYIDFADGKFYVQSEQQEWKNIQKDGVKLPLKCGVSSFGFGGSNAHILMEESVYSYEEDAKTGDLQVIVLSAEYEEGLRNYAEQLQNYLSSQAMLKTENEAVLLKRIAYTLQTGRKQMQYRAAFLVSTREELLSLLSSYIGERKESGILLLNSSKEELSCPLVDMALNWVKGGSAEWSSLYVVKPEKLPLPTYPFQKISHWISPANKDGMYFANKVQPLLGELSIEHSLGTGIVFKKILSSGERFIRDHKVNGSYVMPGTGYLEMGAEALREIETFEAVKFSNIIWNKQVIVNEATTKPIYISIKPEGDRYQYQIQSKVDSELPHGSGFITPWKPEKREHLPIGSIQERCQERMYGEQFYHLIGKEAGIEYGAYYRGVKELYLNNHEALAKLELPEDIYAEQQNYYIHPTVMDCALQTMACLIRHESKENQTKIPFLANNITVYNTLQEKQYYVYVTPVQEGIHDITLSDKDGLVLVKIHSLVSRSISSERTPFFVPTWRKISSETAAKRAARERAVVIYSQDSKEVKEKLADILGTDGVTWEEQVSFRDVNEWKAQIMKAQPEVIYLLSGWIKTYNPLLPKENFSNYQNLGIRSFFSLLKALSDYPKKIQLCVITNKVNEVNMTGDPIPVNAGISSMSQTAMMENPNLLIRLYDFDSIETCNKASLLNIVQRNNIEEQLCITGHGSYEKKIVKLELEQGRVGTAFQERGTYLIAGMGGIGREIGYHLAKMYHATVIYASRGKQDTEREQVLKEIEQLGGKSYYIQTDVTNGGHVLNMVERMDQLGFHRINGLIFAAMVLNDVKISQMTYEQFDNVLAPKVYGTLELFRALKDKITDFALVLSSVSALIGNIGQVNYNAACATQDAIAASMRSYVNYPIQTINWSYWGSAGAVSDKKHHDILKKLGLYPINTAEGIDIIERVLVSKLDQVIVFKAREEVWKKMRFEYTEEIAAPVTLKETLEEVITIREDDKSFAERVESWLKEELAKILKLDLKKINSNRTFDEMGMDSMLTIEMNKNLSKVIPSLASTVLFEYSTLQSLSDYLILNYKEELSVFHETASIDIMTDNQKPLVTPLLQNIAIRHEEEPPEQKMDIAVIGMAGKYPGAEDVEAFWNVLYQGKDLVTEIPKDRWDNNQYYSPGSKEAGKTYSRFGAFLSDVYSFDHKFFEISEDRAKRMDPQERLMMELIWNLLEDSGYPYRTLSHRGDLVSTYVGLMYSDYETLAAADLKSGYNDAQSSHWLIPNHIANYYDFRGPCMAIDTACSSSLTAIHLACQSLMAKESDVAIAGGVSLILDPRHYLRLSAVQNLSTTNQTKSFGEGGDGYVVGEGIGAVLLKPLKKAVLDKDRIYGVIKGSGINFNGATSSFMSSSPAAQEILIRDTIQKSGMNAGTINYIEAHGTGTGFGDAIEIRGLEKAFASETKDTGFCSIGSVKSNIGHLEAAAGISALTKVLLQMKHKKLLPILNFNQLSSYIKLEHSPFKIQRQEEDWRRITADGVEYPLRAGISSFGAGGSNACLMVEEYVSQDVPEMSSMQAMIPISAKNSTQLTASVKGLIKFLERNPELRFNDIAYSLQISKEPMKVRLAVVCNDKHELIKRLGSFLEGQLSEKVYYSENESYDETKSYEQFVLPIAISAEETVLKWVNGENFAWRESHKNGGTLISLPSYPFQKITWKMDSQLSLIEDNNCFTYHYDDNYLKDHISFGDEVLLGVTHLSLVIDTLNATYKNVKGLRIRKFLLVEPVIVNEDESIAVKIEIEEKTNHFRSLYRKDDVQEYRVAAEGEYDFAEVDSEAELSVSKVDELCKTDGLDIYEHKWPGVYGKSLQTISRTGIENKKVFAFLRVTDLLLEDGRMYNVPPAILDGAIVSRCALLDDREERVPRIPLMIKNVTIYGPLTDSCISSLEKVNENEEICELNIKIYNERGTILVAMNGVLLKTNRSVYKKTERQTQDTTIQHPNKKTGGNVVAELNESTWKQAVEKYITDKLTAIIPQIGKNIKTTKNFLDMGVVSLDLVQLAKDMEQDMGSELFPTVFFEYPSIKQLTDYLYRDYKDEFMPIISAQEMPLSKEPIKAEEILRGNTAVYKEERPMEAEPEEFVSKKIVKAGQEPVAIIGISGMMPGCDDLDDFFEKLKAKKELISEIPRNRWDWRDYYRGDTDDASKTNVTRAGFMKQVDQFDHGFFNISPREADLMDPQQRLTLELVWKLIEDAGYNPEELSGSNTGVFIGVSGHDYNDLLNEHDIDSRAQALTGNAHNVLTGRVSYFLNLLGPSEPIDTACSSGLVAIQRGIQNLTDHTCDMVIAGGVNLITHQSLFIAFDNVGILNENGKCSAFDKEAAGTVRGEGAGFVLLKPLDKAVRDGDHIYGVIRGSAINHGGHASSLTAPNVKQQTAVITAAIKKSGIPPETITYIESHGTGTKLGDPIEVNGLKEAFRNLGSGRTAFGEESCAIGTLKSNIGHLEAASGMASLLKGLYSMKQNILPGNLNFNTLNPYINLSESPFYLPRDTREWKHLKDEDGAQIPYRFGISAFGFNGVNAHVVVEEYIDKNLYMDDYNGEELIVLSARGSAELDNYVSSLKTYLERRTPKNKVQNAASIIPLISSLLVIPEDFLEEGMKLEECGFSLNSIHHFMELIIDTYGIAMDYNDLNLNTHIYEINNRIQAVETSENVLEIDHLVLSKIAYTLQTGRPFLKEKAAFLVKNIDDLIYKLNKYLTGNRSEAGIYTSDFLQNSVMETSDRDRVQMYLENRNLEALAKLWLNGIEIKDWKQLYAKGIQKVSLPTYPFKEDKHWIHSKKRKVMVPNPVTEARLTDLIDRRILNTQEISFEKNLTGKEWYLEEHKLNGIKTLPGVMYLEIARMAALLANPKQQIGGLNNFTWSHPIKVEDKEQILTVSFDSDQTGYFKIKSGESAFNASGKVTYGCPEPKLKKVNIRNILENCTGSLNHEEFYVGFEAKGFGYGTNFKRIKQIRYSDNIAVSIFEKNSGNTTEHGDYVFDPVILEGALQTAGYLVNTNIGDGNPAIPFGIESFQLYEKLPNTCIAIASLNTEKDNDVIKHINILITDGKGNVKAEIKNYVARENNPARKSNLPEQSKSCYYEPQWSAEKGQSIEQNHEDELCVLLGDEDGTIKKLTDMNFPAHLTVLQKESSTISGISKETFVLDMSDETCYEKLLDKIKSFGYKNVLIVNTWDARTPYGNKMSREQQLQNGIFNLALLTKELHKQSTISSMRYLYAYNKNNPIAASMEGYVKCLRLETGKIKMKTVALSRNSDISMITREIHCDWDNFEVMYSNNERYVKTLKEVQDKKRENGSKLKSEGTYWITGGMGGIGQTIAEYLMAQYGATVILTGRTALNADLEQRVKQLGGGKGRAIYLQGDLYVLEQVRNIYNEIKSTVGHLDGLIHCAGMIHDKLAIRKSLEEMREVMKPKLEGTINLDYVTREENLDFILLFSSITAELGNMGQSDYAFANCFLDKFSQYRESCRKQGKRNGDTISVNWPYIKIGSMKLLNNELGFEPLSESDFLESFEYVLTRKSGQVLLHHGDKIKFNKLFNNKIKLQGQVKKAMDGTNNNILENKLKRKIIQLVSSISHIEEDKISDKALFDEFGFDSIVITEFTTELKKKYDITITPSLFYEIPDLTINKLCNHLTAEQKEATAEENVEEIDLFAYEEEVFDNKESENDADHVSDVLFKEQLLKRKSTYEPIAIIGLAGKMPQSDDLDEFWSHLMNNDDVITEVQKDRWDWEEYYGNPITNGKTLCKWGGFLKNAGYFDAKFFNISPNEAVILDPQQRLSLEAAWKSVENAGYAPSGIRGTKTGVFMGASNSDYVDLYSRTDLKNLKYAIGSSAHFLIANRISHFMDLQGPSETIDTACSSAAVAIHRAVTALQNEECDLALAGGVNLLTSVSGNIRFDSFGMLSHDGKVKTLDKDADGFIRSEGIGVMVLKPLKNAIADKDTIHAVILGSAVRHCGTSKSVIAPNPNGETEVIREAIQKSGLDPEAIEYIELQGAGSLLGDEIEVQAINKAFRKLGKNEKNATPCVIGSVKTNVGHLEAASGMASIFKVILSMKNGTIPASIHCNNLNPFLNLEEAGLQYSTKNKNWDRRTDAYGAVKMRCAGVNVFGAGGTNAHIVLGEYIPEKSAEQLLKQEESTTELCVFSAKTKHSLLRILEEMSSYLEDNQTISLKALSYTLQIARDQMEHRFAVVADSIETLCNKLKEVIAAKDFQNLPEYTFYKRTAQSDRSLFELMDMSNTQLNFINEIQQRNGYDRLAELWTRGLDFDWESIHGHKKRMRMELPTYCFEPKNCWIDVPEKEIKKEQKEPAEISEPKVQETSDIINSDIKSYINRMIMDFLENDTISIQEDDTLSELGIDSIMFSNIKYKLETELNIDISLSEITSCKSVKDFILFLSDKGVNRVELGGDLKDTRGGKDISGILKEIDFKELGEDAINDIYKLLKDKL